MENLFRKGEIHVARGMQHYISVRMERLMFASVVEDHGKTEMIYEGFRRRRRHRRP